MGAAAAGAREEGFIHIRALHESLPGSLLVDPGLLLFSLDGCEVYVLADEHEAVRFMLVRAPKSDAKSGKKDSSLREACQKLRSCYDGTSCKWVEVLRDEDAKVALICYQKPACYDETADKSALGKDRVSAIHDVLQTYTEGDERLALAATPGANVAFMVKSEGVLFSLALDISQPMVEYAELRCVDLSKKDRDTKYTDVAAKLWPGLDFSGKKGSIGGKVDYKILGSAGDVLMGRKDAFFIFTTEERMRQAAAQGVYAKKYGFERHKFSELAVSLPAEDKVDWAALTQAVDPAGEDEPPADAPEEEEEEPAEVTDAVADDSATTAGEDEATTPEPEPTPETPADSPAEPFTPEAARRAYMEILRNL